MAVTLKDIAKKLNLSTAAVSKALSDSPDIGYETKEKVKKLAKEMNYRPNEIARGLVMKETKTIGLILPDITNPFYPEIARGVEDTLNFEGYSLFLCNSNWKTKKEEEYIDLLISKKVDGIIIASIGLDKLPKDFANIPCVTIGIKNDLLQPGYVLIDDEKGGYLATEHLILNGCRNVMFIGGTEKVKSNKLRIKGYKAALKKNGIEIKKEYIRNGNFNRESGYEIFNQVIRDGFKVDGIFAGNDVIALGVIQASNDLNIPVPQKLQVIGFDDISFAQLPEISLTTISQPKYEMGMIASKILLSKIKSPENVLQKVILEPKLVKRKTTINIYDRDKGLLTK